MRGVGSNAQAVYALGSKVLLKSGNILDHSFLSVLLEVEGHYANFILKFEKYAFKIKKAYLWLKLAEVQEG